MGSGPWDLRYGRSQRPTSRQRRTRSTAAMDCAASSSESGNSTSDAYHLYHPPQDLAIIIVARATLTCMTSLRFCCFAALLLACAADHGRSDRADAGGMRGFDASIDAGVDAGNDAGAEPVIEVGRFELPSSFFILDSASTPAGDVCIGGIRKGRTPSPLLPDVAQNDAFVACFNPSGVTRARSWPCQGPAGFGVERLGADPNGGLYIASGDGCFAPLPAAHVERISSTLATEAVLTLTSTTNPPVYFSDIAASADYAVVVGTARAPTTMGDTEAHGPFAAVLARDDLSIVNVVASATVEASGSLANVHQLAVNDNGVALYFGQDIEGGVFAAAGGQFVRTMTLPDGSLENPGDHDWYSEYAALWHPDGVPVLLGTMGDSTTLQVEVGADVHALETQYLDGPYAAFHGHELLIARPFAGMITIAGRTFSSGGAPASAVLVATDERTIEPHWARQLPGGYNNDEVAVLTDGTIAIIACDAVDRSMPQVLITFYR